MICEIWRCPYHACMSSDCQIVEVAKNAPHLIESQSYCEIPQMIKEILEEVKPDEEISTNT